MNMYKSLKLEAQRVQDRITELSDELVEDLRDNFFSHQYRSIVAEQYRSLVEYHIALQERIAFHEKDMMNMKRGAEDSCASD